MRTESPNDARTASAPRVPPVEAPPPRVDEARLRPPHASLIHVGTVLVNLALMVLAGWMLIAGADWIAGYPWFASKLDELRAAAITVVLAPPALVALRNGRRARTPGRSVRISERQLPLVHARFARQCAALGMEPPELYLSETVPEQGPARAFSVRGTAYVVLGTTYLEADPVPLEDVWSFHLGRELGRLRLGYAGWWDGMLLSYVSHVPILRAPLLHHRAFTLDRYGAALAPEGVRGLVILASGRRMLPALDVPDVLARARRYGGLSATLSWFLRDEPAIATRIRRLYDDGYLDWDADLERLARPAG